MNKYNWKSVPFSFLVLLAFQATAQYDTTYIKKYPDALSVIGSANERLYNLTIWDAENKDNKAEYTSSAGLSLGIGFDYKWLSLEYQGSINQKLASDKPPQSIFSYLSLGVSGQKFYARMFYQNLQGLYLDGHSGVDLPGTGQPQIYRDDIVCRTLFISGNYLFNGKKYSHSAAVNQLERQLKSAGSFVAGLTFISNSLDCDSAMVPESYGFSIGENGKIVKGLANSIIPQAGYSHLFVIHENFFVQLSAIPGINFVAFVKELSNNETVKGSETSGFFLEERLAFGFNGEKIFCGISTNGYLFTGKYNADPVTQNHQYFRAYFGIRFGVKKPKFFPEKIY
jgi:Domain of unknown function (DUF4421)